MTHDGADDCDHPLLAPNHPLAPHVLYRLTRAGWQSQDAPPTVQTEL
jgi:hypothetical protein